MEKETPQFRTPEQIKEIFGYIDIPVFGDRDFTWASDGVQEFKISKDGTRTFPQYDSFGNFDEKLELAEAKRKDGKYIFINKQGDQAFPGEFDRARGFANGVAMVVVDGKYYHIKADGTPLYSGRYDFATEAQLNDGSMNVLEGSNVHTINLKGEIISTKPASGSWLDRVKQ